MSKASTNSNYNIEVNNTPDFYYGAFKSFLGSYLGLAFFSSHIYSAEYNISQLPITAQTAPIRTTYNGSNWLGSIAPVHINRLPPVKHNFFILGVGLINIFTVGILSLPYSGVDYVK